MEDQQGTQDFGHAGTDQGAHAALAAACQELIDLHPTRVPAVRHLRQVRGMGLGDAVRWLDENCRRKVSAEEAGTAFASLRHHLQAITDLAALRRSAQAAARDLGTLAGETDCISTAARVRDIASRLGNAARDQAG